MNKQYKFTDNLIYSNFLHALPNGKTCVFYADASVYVPEKEAGVAVFDIKTGELIGKYPFTKEAYTGSLVKVSIDEFDYEKWAYTYYCGDSYISDSRAERYIDIPKYGEFRKDYVAKAVFDKVFDYSDDIRPAIKYEDAFVYQLHVRGFTKHSGSGTKYKGTFKGVKDKLDYLKELGVTTLEFQPVYEFPECDVKTGRLNYWGYCEGYYYAPKAAYAYSDKPSEEFYDLVKAIHKNGQEIILQMFFPGEFSMMEIVNILEYWTVKYHVDGFHILSADAPLKLIDESSILSESKIWCVHIENIKSAKGGYFDKAYTRRYALYRDDYLYSMRKFLKADEYSISDAIAAIRNNNECFGCINYFDAFNSMTLFDMVAYERKHNEENGEENRDGNDYNCSWNCGEEGNTRKAKIVALRKKQIRNALVMLMLSAGTPMIYMGDEMGRTQNGNNNPYCIDSAVNYVDWSGLKKQYSQYEFIKELIAIRKSLKVLHSGSELSLVDVSGCGFPELSYHSDSAWKSQTDGYRHNVGIMFCDNGKLLYMAVNMHWDAEKLALPRAPKGTTWKLLLTTGEEVIIDDSLNVELPEHTICLFTIVDKRNVISDISNEI